MMRKAYWAGGLCGAMLLTTAVYGWGAGWFRDACSPVLTIFTDRAKCTPLIAFSGERINTLALGPDGALVVLTQDIDTPADRKLVAFAPLDGSIRQETSLEFSLPLSPVTASAINQKGTQIALGFNGYPVQLVTLKNGTGLPPIPVRSAANLTFTDDGSLIVDPGRYHGAIPAAGDARGYMLHADTVIEKQLDTDDAQGLFVSGTDIAVSVDGRYFAQNMRSRRNSLQVNIRIGRTEMPNHTERMLTTELAERCTYGNAELAFSPNGAMLAAAFPCPYSWGKIGSALIVWELATGRQIAAYPTHYDWKDMLWLTNDRLAARRFNTTMQTSAVYRFDLNSGR